MDNALPVTQRRGESRATVSIPAAVFAEGFHQPVELECTNLSSSGMYLAGNPSLVVDERVLLSFVPPGTPHQIFIDAVVVRTLVGGRRGVGLRFDRMPRNDSDELRSSLERRAQVARAWDALVGDLEFDPEQN